MSSDLHVWVPVNEWTSRMEVPGGWIYNQEEGGAVFVPVPDRDPKSIANSRKAHEEEE